MHAVQKFFFMVSVLVKWIIKVYFSPSRNKFQETNHILFCLVDHFEPGTGNVTDYVAKGRVRKLVKKYPELANKHADSEGYVPKRTWFIPPNQHRNYFLKDVLLLCEKGYGEIELHLHHGKKCPDTSENLKATIEESVKEYSRFGIFGNKKTFGFIHGDWALDNSRNNRFCGVNNELEILKDKGCYADFTFPSKNEANPSKINAIYYAKENPKKPKSYNTGSNVKIAGNSKKDDLMIIQGPLYPYFKTSKLLSLRVSGDEINGRPPITKERIDSWIKTGISIKGKENWIIVKTHTHGATDSDAVLGDEIDQIFSYLESKYNDGIKYVLHYVTARELYNIIKAIEAGKSNPNPSVYRDYLVKPPLYKMSVNLPEASEKLKGLIAKTYED